MPPPLAALFGLTFDNAPIPLQDGRGTVDHQHPAIAACMAAITGPFTDPMAPHGHRDPGTPHRFQATPLRPATSLGPT